MTEPLILTSDEEQLRFEAVYGLLPENILG